jgi:hypothetical protein
MYIDNIRHLSLLTNGIFAGMGLTISLSSVPAINDSNDKLTVWRRTYLNSSKIAITNILISSGCHAFLYYYTGNMMHVYAGILSFASAPFTFLFIAPVNNRLFELYDKDGEKEPDVQPLVNRWSTMQWFRTIFGLSAFMLNIYVR